MTLNQEYWENRYSENNLGWDIGEVSRPLKEYIDQLSRKDLKILVPGAGFGYEVIYLWESGFKNVFVIDLARQPLGRIKQQIPEFPDKQLIQGDFFELKESGFDLILEQTFFCALNPELRVDYVLKMHELLKDNGKLSGLFFDFPLTEKGPPFGGSLEAYKKLFGKHFKIKTLERAYNSIPPRRGNELFFIFER
ncbi:methyltransferase domain-containing protein [Poritiphilus flavus]|uniref:SAM-dependent methyltransferase n=1 Tax=Poritiphilus flavus TaxID=2697053 RepID=A0A6L9EC24_9FLAO|nr:methyltransferase domain-containing protein [Poritiphilus flavus]NAS11969.1 SAM-dependent methyltransferase [Poritiphilus flavus]